jgi:flagellar motor switch/type III secretory pathway protein FliN
MAEVMTENNSRSQGAIDERSWASVLDLPCCLTAELRIPGLTVIELLRLEKGSVLRSSHPTSAPLPLWVNETPIGVGDIESLGKTLGIRFHDEEHNS